MIIDTHCHLDHDDYENIENVIRNMGNNIMIASGVDTKTNHEVIHYVDQYPNIYGMVGIHPENATQATAEDFLYLEECIKNPKIVGIGEIGLDYHYGGEDKELQKEVFQRQIEIAKKYDKPIIIHSRDAYLDTYNMIKEHFTPSLKIVMHCYSYSLESAKELLKYHVKFGIGGVITFKNGKKLQQIVKELSLDHFLLETDSPYLTPEPYRGMKNEPANVKLVALKIAEIKNIPVEEVIQTTTKVACSQFDLPIDI